MPPLLLVMLGGAAGSGARYLGGGVALRLMGPGLPYGTFAVNILGGFLMGLLAGTLARGITLPGTAGSGEPLRLLLGIGVLGGFTTFSSFSLETFTMLARGQYGTAAVYTIASVVLSVAALSAGVGLVRIVA